MDKNMTNDIKTPVIKMLSLDLLQEDPLNREAFSEGDLLALAEDMRTDGFFGNIAAYPIDDNKYMVESGHRRLKAARLADIGIIPVLVTTPPANEIEHRLRLTQWNLNGRDYTPLDVARLVSFTYDTCELKKESGEASGSLIEMTSKELHISTSLVTKYKSLYSLEPALAEIANQKNVSWATVASASSLPKDSQIALARRANGLAKMGMLTTEKFRHEMEECKRMRLFGYSSYFSDTYESPSIASSSADSSKSGNPSEKEAKRYRRSDGSKGILKCRSLLSKCLDGSALIKGKDREDAIRILREISAMADKMADSLNDI